MTSILSFEPLPEDSYSLQDQQRGSVTDRVTCEIIYSALQRIGEEMVITMLHTSRSPIANETRDYSIAIYDGDGRMVVHTHGNPVLMGASKYSVKSILETFSHQLHDGDVILNNDPYSGGSHCGDWTMAMPIFYQGELVMIPSNRCHMVDGGGGGAVAGGFNPVAQLTVEESIVTPPLKLYERGQLRPDVLNWVSATNRTAHWFHGDLEGMRGSLELAKRRILELIERFGLQAVRSAIQYGMEYTERRTRANIAEFPDGVYEGVYYLDGDLLDTLDIRIQTTVTVEGDRLTLDFTGTDPQVPGPANSPWANTLTWVYIAICSCLDPSIPKNEGVWNCIDVHAPPGTLVNPYEGAPSGLCTVDPGIDIGEAVMSALSKAVPQRTGCLGWQIGLPVIFGADPRTSMPYSTLSFEMTAGCAGAAYGVDGWAGATWISAMEFSGPEMCEVQFPQMVLEKEYVPDTGGAGQWRGGPAIQVTKKMIGHHWGVSALMWGQRHPPQGLCGGLPGAPNEMVLDHKGENEHTLHGGKGYVGFFPPDSTVHLTRSGGGGWGDPLERDPRSVREDVIDGYITVEGALRDYGVAIAESALEIDFEETRARRDSMRHHR